MRPVVLLILLSLVSPLSAQQVREVTLDNPTATHPGEFSLVSGLRELDDGSVFVSDPIETRLLKLDPTLRRETDVGRVGPGPGEYKQPDGLWPLPADSTLLVDLGNNRLTVIGPDGRLGNSRVLAEPSANGRGLTLMLPNGVDAQGRVYYRGGMPGADSLPVMRLDRRSGASSQVAMLKGPSVNRQQSGGANDRREVTGPVPLAPSDGWAASPAGRVFVVRASDYHVDVVQPDGSVTSGAPVRWSPIRVTDKDKEEYRSQMQRGGAIGVSMENNNGQMSLSLSRGRMPGGAPPADNFPEVKPPFDPAGVFVDARERLWVRRHLPAGQPARYDVFDQRGSLTLSVRMRPSRRVVGMSGASVYVVRYDEDDLQHLERYALP
jgi:hypothetical protein